MSSQADTQIPPANILVNAYMLGESIEFLYDYAPGDVVPSGGESAGADTTPEGRLATVVMVDFATDHPEDMDTWYHVNHHSHGAKLGMLHVSFNNTRDLFLFLSKRNIRVNDALPIHTYRWRMSDGTGSHMYVELAGKLKALRAGAATLGDATKMVITAEIRLTAPDEAAPVKE